MFTSLTRREFLKLLGFSGIIPFVPNVLFRTLPVENGLVFPITFPLTFNTGGSKHTNKRSEFKQLFPIMKGD